MSIEHLPDLVAQLTPSPSDDGSSESNPLQRMEEPELNIIEVYEQKRLIQGEFEKIAEVYGTELTRGLVPRVARLIKLLESQVIRNEKCVDDLLEAKKSFNKLQFDHYEVRQLRKKHQEELDSIDNQWREENESLRTQLTQLEKENKRLRQDLQRRPSAPVDGPETVALTRADLQAFQNVAEQNTHLVARLRSQKEEFKQATSALESMRQQLDSVAKTNAKLERQQNLAAKQIQSLSKEKLELEFQLREKESIIQQMKERVEQPNEENQESSTPSLAPADEPSDDLAMFGLNETRFSVDVVRQIIWEKIDVKQKLMHAEDEIQVLQEQVLKLTTPPPAPPVPEPPKRTSFWILFSLVPIIFCFAVLRFCFNALRRAKKPTSLTMARRGSLSEVERSSLSSPYVQAGVLMAKSSLPLHSPKASFTEN